MNLLEETYEALGAMIRAAEPEDNGDTIPPTPGWHVPDEQIRPLQRLWAELGPIVGLMRQPQNATPYEYRRVRLGETIGNVQVWAKTPPCFLAKGGEILVAEVSGFRENPGVCVPRLFGASGVLEICLDVLLGKMPLDHGDDCDCEVCDERRGIAMVDPDAEGTER